MTWRQSRPYVIVVLVTAAVLTLSVVSRHLYRSSYISGYNSAVTRTAITLERLSVPCGDGVSVRVRIAQVVSDICTSSPDPMSCLNSSGAASHHNPLPAARED